MIKFQDGIKKTGKKVEIDASSPMKDGKIYEFHYNVMSFGTLGQLRLHLLETITKVEAQFKGLEILYTAYNDDPKELIIQAQGKSTSIWEEAALSIVAIACSGLLLVWGIVILLEKIFEVIPQTIDKIKESPWTIPAIFGGIIFLFLLWPKKKKKKE